MKKFKISLLAIAAVLAMSFTLVSNIENKKETKRFGLGPEDCFVPSASTDIKRQCTDNLIDVVADDCDQALSRFDPLSGASTAYLYALNTGGFIESENILSTCNGDDEFCCFTVESVSQLDCTGANPDQPQITIGTTTTYWKIKAVFCKP